MNLLLTIGALLGVSATIAAVSYYAGRRRGDQAGDTRGYHRGIRIGTTQAKAKLYRELRNQLVANALPDSTGAEASR